MTKLFVWNQNEGEVVLDEQEFKGLHIGTNLKVHSEETKIDLAWWDLVFKASNFHDIIAVDFPSLKNLDIRDIQMHSFSKFGVTYYLPILNPRNLYTTPQRLNMFIQSFLNKQWNFIYIGYPFQFEAFPV